MNSAQVKLGSIIDCNSFKTSCWHETRLHLIVGKFMLSFKVLFIISSGAVSTCDFRSPYYHRIRPWDLLKLAE